jgi:hypothetical protein
MVGVVIQVKEDPMIRLAVRLFVLAVLSGVFVLTAIRTSEAQVCNPAECVAPRVCCGIICLNPGEQCPL